MSFTVTKAQIGEEDIHRWDGTSSKTFTRDTSTGGTLTLKDFGYEVDALMAYGGGVNYTDATIISALTAIGTTNLVSLVLRPGTWTVSANRNWSAYTNVTFKIMEGALISHGAFTLNIPNPQAGPYQWLTGAGAVSYTNAQITYPQWIGGAVNSGPVLVDALNVSAVTSAAVRSALLVEYIRTNANVKDPSYGAVGDGTANDTQAIYFAIVTAGAGGVVYFPKGTYKTTGAYNLSGLHGLQIVGSGIGATIIDIAQTGNDLFYIGSTNTYNLNISGFTVASLATTRTAGWVFNTNSTPLSPPTGSLIRSTIKDIEIRQQFNGIKIGSFSMVRVNNITAYEWQTGAGIGIKIGGTSSGSANNEGAGIWLNDCIIYGDDSNTMGTGTYVLGTAYYVEDVEAVYFQGCEAGANVNYNFRIFKSTSGHQPTGIKLVRCVSDVAKTVGGVHVVGVSNIDISASQFNSGGQITGGAVNVRGLYIEGCDTVRISNGHFFNNKGTGLFLLNSSGVISNSVFASNGAGADTNNNYAIFVQQATLGDDSFNISNCLDYGSNGVSIRSTNTCNKLMVIGNRWKSGVQYDVAPLIDEHNAIT